MLISTKAGWDMWPGPYGQGGGSRKYLLASLDQSLERMGLDYVDIFYSHRFDPDSPLEETMGALATAVHQGKALYAGISSYSPGMTREAARIMRELQVPLLIHQPSYSMLNRWIEEELLDALVEEGMGCIAFSPLAQGVLTDKYLDGVPEDSRINRPGGDSLLPRASPRREHRARPRAERDREGAGAEPGADGARVGAPRPAGDVRADRREPSGAGERERGRAGQPGVHPRGARPRSRVTRRRAASTCGLGPSHDERP